MQVKTMQYIYLYIFCIVISSTSLWANSSLELKEGIDSYTKFNIDYFEDVDNKPLTLKQVRKEKFQTISNAFTFGYSKNNFWFHLTVINESDTEKEMFLELTEIIHQNIDLYTLTSDHNFTVEKNGLSVPVDDRAIKVSNPTFSLKFKAHEKKEFYIKLSSIYTVFGAIHLKTPQQFIDDNHLKDKLYMFYFGAIIILALYNLFIFVYLREKVYLYYVSYVTLFAIWSANYKGLLFSYTTKETYDILQISVPIFFSLLILFSQDVLETKKYFSKFHKILNLYFVIASIAIVLMLIDMHIGFYFINVAAAPLLPILLILSLWAISKGHKIAKIYLTALSIYYVSMIILTLMALGIIPYSVLLSHAPIIGSFFEIFMLSLLLAYRINILRQKTLNTQQKLLEQEFSESIRLSEMVKDKTMELSTVNTTLGLELKEKKTLYYELNHRVKNNLNMIIASLILQINRTNSKKTKEELIITQNRIHSISHLYEYLHLYEQGESADTLTHFKNIITNIKLSEDDDVNVIYTIEHNLSTDSLLYTGLILNELVTNAFKYAFEKQGVLHISLIKVDAMVTMIIEDDGPGFSSSKSHSLGLTIVKTLVKDQLFGEMDMATNNGTKITISWREHE